MVACALPAVPSTSSHLPLATVRAAPGAEKSRITKGTTAPFRLIFAAVNCIILHVTGIAKGGTFMRKIILVVASAVALGTATMTTGALGADQPGFVGRPGPNHRLAYQCFGTAPGTLAYHHGHFDPCFGPVPGTYASWYAHEHRNDDCWDGRRWVLGTRLGWTWQACVWP